MNNHARYIWGVLLTLVLLTGLGVAGDRWLRPQRRQYALNRQLIVALMEHDNPQALALVQAGADPNTRYEPTPVASLPTLMKQFFSHTSPPANDSPTALLLACGAWRDEEDGSFSYSSDALIREMLLHGANVNAQDRNGWTALHWAVQFYIHTDISRQLLAHGANPNLTDKQGKSPLMLSQQFQNPDIVALLRHYGARK